MAGSGSAQLGGGPTPWWQLPQPGGRSGQSTLQNLEASAPAGYEYDPVTMGYRRTPTSAGQRLGSFESAAFSSGPFGGGLPPSLAGLTSSIGGTGVPGVGGTGAVGGAGGPVAGGAAAPALQMPDTSAATSAAFARAKDQAGQMTRASLDSLAGELGAQNMLGSGAQYQGAADILSKGTNLMGEESRTEAEKTADLAADFAKTGYQGAITQRGQDIAAQEANARLALESRQQIMQMLGLALQGIGGGSSSAAGLLY